MKETRLPRLASFIARRVTAVALLVFPAMLQAQFDQCPSSHRILERTRHFEDLDRDNRATLGFDTGKGTEFTPVRQSAGATVGNSFNRLTSGSTAICYADLQNRGRALELADSKQPDQANKQSVLGNSKPLESDRQFYYRNKLEFSLDSGWLPINIPFVFDVFLGDAYNRAPLNYTLVPIIASIRWQVGDVGGPWIFRGNWDVTASGAVTLIPRGPETHYYAWIMGIRRNFVPRRGRIAPYFDGRVGLGGVDAKGPLGVLYAQGQNFTFTVNMGSGFRYNFNSRYSISAGLNWMHISNLYLSEPQFANYGINVYGPMFGINMRLGRPRSHASG